MHPVSQLFIFGFPGYELTKAIRSFIEKAHPGGFIFFDDNCYSLDQVSELAHSIHEFYQQIHGHPPWLSIDHENKAVQRLPSPITQFPTAEELGPTLTPTTAALMGRTMGQELRDLGFNLNFAPVCDVATVSTPKYLRDRCFSTQPETVAKIVEHFIPAMQKEGVWACAKHFPGLGSAGQDPHHEGVQTQRSKEDFEHQDWKVFSRAITAGVISVMTTHVLCSALDPNDIATYSSQIVQKSLIQALKFQGLVISDDLKMGAVQDPPAQGALKALQAGHHLIIFSTRELHRHLQLLTQLQEMLKSHPQLESHMASAQKKSQAYLQKIAVMERQ